MRRWTGSAARRGPLRNGARLPAAGSGPSGHSRVARRFRVTAVAERSTEAGEWRVLPDLRGVRVLVVEDEPIMRRLFRAWLEQLGATVHEAHDGRQGLELARTAPIDVVLCDLSMPVVDGYALIRGMRE